MHDRERDILDQYHASGFAEVEFEVEDSDEKGVIQANQAVQRDRWRKE
jgi:hypothetical protein